MGRKMKMILVSALSSTLVLSGCAPENGVRQRNIDLQFASYTTAKYKMIDFLQNLFVPKAHAAVGSLKFCFKRLRFKRADEDTLDAALSEDNVDFNLGEVTVSDASTILGTIRLPEGEYRRVEFDLENHCASGLSIQLTNTNGSFSTNQRVTIKFSGLFNANADGVLTLGVQSILNQLNTYNGVGTLKDSAEAASGVLSN